MWLLVLVAVAPDSSQAEFGFSEFLHQDEESHLEHSAETGQAHQDGRRTLKRFPRNLGLGFTGVFTKQNLKPFLIGGAVTAGSFVFDDTFRAALSNEGSDAAEIADDYGGPIALGALTTGLFVAGRYSSDQKFRDVTYDMAVAALVNLAYTGALKAAVSRDRPNDSGSDSFPSGHSSNAFALATVAAHHYKGKLRLIAYGGATVIAASRLRADAHWLSDVVGGATLGILVGRGVVWVNNRPVKNGQEARQKMMISPLLGKDTYGLTIQMSLR
jgi:membrane-associated phospholipid phosphatase